MLGYTTPPPRADTPGQTPLGRHPLGRHLPADGFCCRWYTSYWNAFLFIYSGNIQTMVGSNNQSNPGTLYGLLNYIIVSMVKIFV